MNNAKKQSEVASKEPPCASDASPHAPEFLTVEEAAKIAGMTKGWMYAHAPWLGARKHGRYLRFHRDTLIERLRDSDVPTAKRR